jgi:cell fate (sporulation/competence/biofilm development) regulator YlbF (YheA/YmcA/DUF963 family)
MSDDDFSAYTPEERQTLRNILRDPGTVKDLFNQNRAIFSKAMEQMKQLNRLDPNLSGTENLIMELKTRLDLNDTIEALALNEIQLRDLLKEIVDAVITNKLDKLKEIRQQLDR